MSQTIDLSVPHKLGKEEARRRIAEGVSKAKRDHAAKVGEVSEQWTGDQLSFVVKVLGQSVTGRALVLEDAVKVSVDLPWLLARLAGTIRPQIEHQAQRMLEGPK